MTDSGRLRRTFRDARGRTVTVFETRQQMVESTNRFLSQSLRRGGFLRIPRIRMDRGGFAPMLRHRGARALVRHWWAQVLESGQPD